MPAAAKMNQIRAQQRRTATGQAEAVDNAEATSGSTDMLQFLTLGRVLDTNDPMQMGRVRAICPGFGDHDRLDLADYPWCMAVSPLGGMTNFGTRGAPGRGSDVPSVNQGPVAYGMWNIPTIGSYVLVGCVDGDAGRRFYVGCIHPQFLTHTQPHGRWTWSTTDGGSPNGPLDSFENPIEPTHTYFTNHFMKPGGAGNRVPGTPNDPRKNMEYRTRAVDTQAAAIDSEIIKQDDDHAPGSQVIDKEDDDFTKTQVNQEDGTTRTIEGQGYSVSQLDPQLKYEMTGDRNFDSHTYSWTTPGFHSMSMDDRHWNCRMRFRTTSGHQIIMDDTNERIYISTAEGKTWIELDQVGNIDIFAERNLSVRASGDINFTTDQTFRVNAKEGIHFYSDDEFRAHSRLDMSFRSDAYFRAHSSDEMRLQTDTDFELIADDNITLQAFDSYYLRAANDVKQEANQGVLHLLSGSNMRMTTADQMDLLASANIIQQGANIHLNGPPATASTVPNNAEPAEEKWSYWTSRVPEHEPWARTFMKPDDDGGADNDGLSVPSGPKQKRNAFTPEYEYTDQLVGRGSKDRTRDKNYNRNKLWHR